MHRHVRLYNYDDVVRLLATLLIRNKLIASEQYIAECGEGEDNENTHGPECSDWYGVMWCEINIYQPPIP